MRGGLPILKDLWIYHIFPLLSPRDLSNLKLTSKDFYCFVGNLFEKEIDYWRNITRRQTPSYCMFKAARFGQKDLIDMYIGRGVDFNYGLYGAALGEDSF